jgi:hypothetical protein
VDEELAVFLVLGMKGEPEQPFLVFLVLVIDLRFDIEERDEIAGGLLVVADQNLAVLGKDEDPL